VDIVDIKRFKARGKGKRGEGYYKVHKSKRAEDRRQRAVVSVQRRAYGGQEKRNTIPKILRYSFIILVLLTNRKDYEHFSYDWGFLIFWFLPICWRACFVIWLRRASKGAGGLKEMANNFLDFWTFNW
jgi:hypothetical protein